MSDRAPSTPKTPNMLLKLDRRHLYISPEQKTQTGMKLKRAEKSMKKNPSMCLFKDAQSLLLDRRPESYGMIEKMRMKAK